MGWRTVDHMSGTSPVCTACGQAPRNQETDDFLPAYTADGVDVDWGNNLYICYKCMDSLVQLHGSMPPEEAEKKETRVENLENEVEALKTQLEEQGERIEAMLRGAKARKELKEATK